MYFAGRWCTPARRPSNSRVHSSGGVKSAVDDGGGVTAARTASAERQVAGAPGLGAGGQLWPGRRPGLALLSTPRPLPGRRES